MAQYIYKSALVAEIERLSDIISQGMFTDESRLGIEYFKERVLSFIDTLEVKEVDLEREIESYWKQCDLTWCRDAYTTSHIRIMLSDIAKHFFELGLKAQKGEE